MRILLADDHHLVREAIASYLTRVARVQEDGRAQPG